MKNIFIFILALFSFSALNAQSVIPIRADTVLITKKGGNANLRIENATRHIKGLAINGDSAGTIMYSHFSHPNDSTYIIAGDTLHVGGGNSSHGIDDVLALDQYLSQDRNININSHKLIIYDSTKYNAIQFFTDQPFGGTTSGIGSIDFRDQNNIQRFTVGGDSTHGGIGWTGILGNSYLQFSTIGTTFYDQFGVYDFIGVPTSSDTTTYKPVGIDVSGNIAKINGWAGGGSYTLPAATTSTRGGVRPDGTTITISGDVISAAGGGSSFYYDVINYLGSGAGDTVSAINAAIADASSHGGGIVLLRSGKWGVRTSYLSGSTYKPIGIVGASNVTLQGEGVGKTVIIQDAPPVGSTFDTTSFATNTHFANIITCTSCNNFNITDLSINGTLSRQINHTTNPYSNPQYGLGSDTVQTNAIGIVGGNGNYIYGVRIDSVQGYGVSINGSYQAYISRIYAATSINGGVFFVNVCNGSVLTNSIITNNYADNVRLLSGNITIDNCEVSWSKFNNRGGTNANFAGIYVQNNSKSLTRSITVSNCRLHDNSSYGVDCFNVDTTNYTWQGTTVSVIGNQIYHNAGGGIQVQMQWMSIEGNQIFNNGQDSNGVIDPEGAPGWGIIGHGTNSNGLFVDGNIFRNNIDSGQQLYAFGIGSVGTIPVFSFTNNIQSGGIGLINTASFGLKSSAPYNTIFGNTFIDSSQVLSSAITLDNIGNFHFAPKIPTLGGVLTGTMFLEGANDAYIFGSHGAASNRAFNIVDQYGLGGQSELGLRFSESGAYISSGSGDTARSGAFYDFKNSLNRGGWNSLGEFIWGPSISSHSFLVHQPSYVIPSGGNIVEIIGAGSGSTGGAYNLLSVEMNAGYTGSGITRGQLLQNLSAGTASNIGPASVAAANYGLVDVAAGASATGANVGTLSRGQAALKNIGAVGDASFTQFNSASAISGGVIGYALRANASAIEFGGYFGLQATQPTFESAGLIADNGSESVPVFKARVNGVTKTSIDANGNLIQTTAEQHAYRGITAARTLDATDYLINCTANSFTVTLPTAVGIAGRQYIIKNTGTSTTITMATTSSQTIDGAAPGTITTVTPLRVQSDGANWITF